jgi:hypothetical protein
MRPEETECLQRKTEEDHADAGWPVSASPLADSPQPAASQDRPLLVRFCDAFLQEQNIKWLLGLGMLILLGSSAMLVTSHWATYTPVWKYLVLLGYTVLIHLAGQVAYHHLLLRKTGTGLMALTVLLIPLSFLALRWVHPEGMFTLGGLLSQSGLLSLLAVNGLFSSWASKRIFRHFLRRTEPVFLASYLLLAFSGAVIPALPATLASLASLLLWGLYAVGSIAVNRHVFSLTLAYRLPRIFGFFPILLLAGQFLILFAAGLAPHVPLEWIGFGLVLTAIPWLHATDALARACSGRVPDPVDVSPNVTGGDAVPTDRGPSGCSGLLNRPAEPAPIVLPLLAGLVMTVAGVCLTGVGFPETFALVPASALAAIVMGVVATRTGQAGFVWGMLLMITVAYQSSPVFFQELARNVVQTGAAAVQEQRLPWAFYGLTYLPLVLAVSVAGWWSGKGAEGRRGRGEEGNKETGGQRRSSPLPLCPSAPLPSVPSSRPRQSVFTRPLCQFAVGVPLLLLAVAYTHPKAIFPVGLALTGLFGLQLILFRNSRLLLAGIAAFLTAAIGFTPFLTSVLLMPEHVELPLLAWLTAGALLLVPGMWIDRWASSQGEGRGGNDGGTEGMGGRGDRGDGAIDRVPFVPCVSPSPLSPRSDPSSLHSAFNPQPATSDWCQGTSLIVALLVAGAWLLSAAGGVVAPVSGLLCFVLLLSHAFRWMSAIVCGIALGFPVLLAVTLAADAGWSPDGLVTLAVGMLAGISMIGRSCGKAEARRLKADGFAEEGRAAWDSSHSASQRVCDGDPDGKSPTVRAFGRAGNIVATLGLVLMHLLLIPWLVLAAFAVTMFHAWLAAGLALAAMAELGWRKDSAGLVALAWGHLLVLAAAMGIVLIGHPFTIESVPLLWAGIALVCVPLVRGSAGRWGAWNALRWCVGLTLAAIAVWSLPVLGLSSRLAGLLAVAGLFALTASGWRRTSVGQRLNHRSESESEFEERRSLVSELILVLANAHVLTWVVRFALPELDHLGNLTPSLLADAALPMAFAAALSALLWERRRVDWETGGRGDTGDKGDTVNHPVASVPPSPRLIFPSAAPLPAEGNIALVMAITLQLASAGLLLFLLPWSVQGLTAGEALLAAGTFLVLAGLQCWLAVFKATARRGDTTVDREKSPMANPQSSMTNDKLEEVDLPLGIGDLSSVIDSPPPPVASVASVPPSPRHAGPSAPPLPGEGHVWGALAILVLGLAYLWLFGVISFGTHLGLFGPLVAAGLAWVGGVWSAGTGRFTVFSRPLLRTALALPAGTVLFGIGRHLSVTDPQWLGMNSLALLLAGGFYFWRGLESGVHLEGEASGKRGRGEEERRRVAHFSPLPLGPSSPLPESSSPRPLHPDASTKPGSAGYLVGSAVTLNVAVAMLWRELHWSDPQLFLIPIGISVLALVELLRSQVPVRLHNPLRYAGALTILVSPTFHIVGGSWLHLVTLMLASIAVVLVAMGLRVRALMYTGTAFLLADLVGMVVRGSFDHPSLLWLTGIGTGAAVILLAAYCERHRERMLQRLRMIAARLETWS